MRNKSEAEIQASILLLDNSEEAEPAKYYTVTAVRYIREETSFMVEVQHDEGIAAKAERMIDTDQCDWETDWEYTPDVENITWVEDDD